MSVTPTVFVLDDDDAVRDSLRTLFESCDIPAKTFASADAFLDTLKDQGTVGCIVSDVRMPGLGGLELQQLLLEKSVPLPVIIITGHGDLPMAVEAMKAGAVDFIEKPIDDEVILQSVREALSRGVKMHAHAAAEETMRGNIRRLTARERQVLEQVALGHPNKVVAYNLDISPRTVEIHRSRVIEKLNARNLSHLVRIALASGIITADDIGE